MVAPLIGHLLYLYVGSADIERDLALYREGLGGELAWRFEGAGAVVAAVRLGQGPLVLLADHRPTPSVLPIWEVDDLEAASAELKESGWGEAERRRVEVPDGPCLVLADPSGNELGLLQRTRGEPMARAWREREDR